LPHDCHGERLQCDFGVQRLARRGGKAQVRKAGTGRCRAVPAANVFIVVLWWRSAAFEDPESGARRDQGGAVAI
jgi:hypothetical protein